MIDSACEHSARDCYRVHQVIDVTVLRYSIDPSHSFSLCFESGHTLTVFDDSEQYECFSVHLEGGGDVFV